MVSVSPKVYFIMAECIWLLTQTCCQHHWHCVYIQRTCLCGTWCYFHLVTHQAHFGESLSLLFWDCDSLNTCVIESKAVHIYIYTGFSLVTLIVVITAVSDRQLCITRALHNDCSHIMYSSLRSIMSHQEIIFHLNHQRSMRISWPSSWYLIIRAVWSFLLPRLRSSDRDVPPTAELHSEPWGRLLLCLCGCSWNRPCVSNSMTMKAPAGSRRISLRPIKPIVLHSSWSLQLKAVRFNRTVVLQKQIMLLPQHVHAGRWAYSALLEKQPPK